jgi:hypothetical protein
VVSLSLNQFLALYTWFPLAALLMFMLLIARFYEKFSGKRVYFRFFLIPLVFFGISSVRYAGLGHFTHDLLADAAMTVGGVGLCVLCFWLYWQMIVQTKPK